VTCSDCWPFAPPRTCARLVYLYIGQLRGMLEPERPRRSPAELVQRVHGGYRLELGADQLDLVEWDELSTRAAQARRRGDVETARELYGRALECWRGPVLADAGVGVRRHPLALGISQRRVAAALVYADLALEAGPDEHILDRLRPVAAEEPLHEGLAVRLMLALAGRGEQAAALTLFEDIRARLADELGIEPGTELQDAHLRVLRHQLPTAPATATVVAGGSAPVPAQLPAAVTAFTGRTAYLEQLDDLLPQAGADQVPAVVISAIAGTAGVGKTALAVHWAHRARTRFVDGQLYVNLRGYAPTPPLRPIEALARFLHALGMPAEQVPTDVDEAAALYRSLLADRRVLVVLDNAHSPDQVRPLLPGNPHCMVVVTSRDQLAGLVAREGALRLSLDVLTPDEAHSLLGRVLGADRVRAEPDATAELARLCAYLPLALRTAAANLLGRPQDTMAAHAARLRAGNRLAALAVEGDEQAAVRAAFDLSYAGLPAQARRLFRLLGLVPGPDITADAAAALADTTPDHAEPLLKLVASAHLIDEHAPGRFAFHDLLRLYAVDRVTADDSEPDRQAARHRLLDYYLRTADAAARVLYPDKLRLPVPTAAGTRAAAFADHTRASEWLDVERTNLAAAVNDAAEHGPHPVAWLLADALRGYYYLRRYTVEWLTTAEAGLASAEADGEVQAQAAGHLSIGTLHDCQSRHPQAIEHYTRALALARQAGWRDGEAATLGNFGMVYETLGQLERAAEHHARALTVYQQTGRLAGQATTHNNLGSVLSELGQLEQAADHCDRALDLYRQIGSRGGEARTLAVLGEVHRWLGRFDLALEHLPQALTLTREVGDRAFEALVLGYLAAVHRDAGRLGRALDLARPAPALARDADERSFEADAYATLATIHHRLGEHRKALEHHRKAVRLGRDSSPYSEASGRIGLATVHAHLGQPEHARTEAEQALALTRRNGYRVLEGQALTALAMTENAQNQPDRAAEHAHQALAVHRQTGNRLGEARTHLLLGRVFDRTGRPDAAEERRRRALAMFTEIGAPEADEVRILIRNP
jgi:tetratricopeptide (TPR) repeat protein/DNA-binding SARP family transcriptional activator